MWSMDSRIAWRNIWRNPRRTILTMLAIAFAAALLVFMVSVQIGSYEAMIDSAVGLHTGHVQIRAKEYGAEYAMHLVVPEPARVEQALAGESEILAMTNRCRAFALLASRERTYAGMVLGVEPEREPHVSTLQSIVRQGTFLDAGDTNTAVIGEMLARNLRVGIGDEVTLLGQGRDGSMAASVLTVKGIFSSGQTEMDRSTMYIPLTHFQETFAMREAVHEIVLKAAHPDRSTALCASASDRIHTVNPKLEAQTWYQLMPGLLESIQMDLASSIVFHAILIVVVAFSILNTFIMVVFERTREFGVLLAMGSSSGRIIRILLQESAFLNLAGITLGVTAGCLATLYAQRVGIPLGDAGKLLAQFGLPSRMYPRLSLLSALIGPGVVFVLTMLSALFPALRVRRLRPAKAMREA